MKAEAKDSKAEGSSSKTPVPKKETNGKPLASIFAKPVPKETNGGKEEKRESPDKEADGEEEGEEELDDEAEDEQEGQAAVKL